MMGIYMLGVGVTRVTGTYLASTRTQQLQRIAGLQSGMKIFQHFASHAELISRAGVETLIQAN